MKISNSDLSLLLNQQKELLNLMQMNQESLIRIEKYLKMLFIHNIVCDYENIMLQNNQGNRKFLLTRFVNIVSTIIARKT